MWKTVVRCSLAVAIAFALVGVAEAQTWSNSGQWAEYHFPNYIIYNNIWGSGAGTQTLNVNTQSGNAPNWWVQANHPNTGGIKSYPNVKHPGSSDPAISALNTIPSSWSVTRPNTGAYNSAYDVWCNGYSWEIMIWLNQFGAVGPLGSQQATNQSIAGANWNVFRGNNGSNEVVSFIRTSNTNSVSNMDVKQFLTWIVNRGWFNTSTTLTEVQAGFEITSGSGTWTTNSFTCAQNLGGGGGGTFYKFRNVATSLYIDGMGHTANGSNCGQYANGSSFNQQWTRSTTGGFVKLQNRGTGLYIDGMGRTTNGSACGQYGNNSSNNQQWTESTVSGNYKFQNRGTGLFLDGMGRTSNGSDLGQWGSSSSNNQRFARTQI